MKDKELISFFEVLEAFEKHSGPRLNILKQNLKILNI